jgi:hypothetical protein
LPYGLYIAYTPHVLVTKIIYLHRLSRQSVLVVTKKEIHENRYFSKLGGSSYGIMNRTVEAKKPTESSSHARAESAQIRRRQ